MALWQDTKRREANRGPMSVGPKVRRTWELFDLAMADASHDAWMTMRPRAGKATAAEHAYEVLERACEAMTSRMMRDRRRVVLPEAFYSTDPHA